MKGQLLNVRTKNLQSYNDSFTSCLPKNGFKGNFYIETNIFYGEKRLEGAHP